MEKNEIKKYILKYKDSYSKDQIVSQLKNSGTSDNEIDMVYSNLDDKNSNTNTKPNKVSLALKLFYLMIIIGIIRLILDFSITLEALKTTGFGLGFLIFTNIFIFGIIIFFIYMIGKGKNWARIIFLIFFILGTPLSILPLINSLSVNFFSGSLGLIQVILQLVAFVLLFQNPSSIWFKSNK
jgi:hypothetical protein